MTKPRLQQGRAAGSQALGITAYSPGDYAWNVNFNNGNANWNDQDNDNHVRAVRASEYRGDPSFRSLHAAWKRARRGKKPSPNQLSFDTHWIDGLLELEQQLVAGTWQPRPTTCFIATSPKAREIHAPDFADRIVHHWIVPQLEAIYEPIFIFDSFSNRKAKGTHAAVERLQAFMREVHSGQGGGWYLQLDIKNFNFNRIHRPTLYGLLKERMEKHGCRRSNADKPCMRYCGDRPWSRASRSPARRQSGSASRRTSAWTRRRSGAGSRLAIFRASSSQTSTWIASTSSSSERCARRGI